jgi:hypothetical protein
VVAGACVVVGVGEIGVVGGTCVVVVVDGCGGAPVGVFVEGDPRSVCPPPSVGPEEDTDTDGRVPDDEGSVPVTT